MGQRRPLRALISRGHCLRRQADYVSDGDFDAMLAHPRFRSQVLERDRMAFFLSALDGSGYDLFQRLSQSRLGGQRRSGASVSSPRI